MSGRPPGKIRIVGGAHRGRRLKVAAGTGVRPTSERVREAVFDALGPVGGVSVLDMFAGTGAMGLEALSRGATSCVFIENDPAVAVTLKENIAALDYQAEARVLQLPYERALLGLSARAAGFDLLFVDPPYRILPEVEVVLKPLLPSLLLDDGIAVVEGSRKTCIDLGRSPVFDRTYGDTRITMIAMRRGVR